MAENVKMLKSNVGISKENEPRAVSLLKLYEVHKGRRGNWESYWQSLHDYFYVESPDINYLQAAGAELRSDYLYDATTLDCADVLSAGFMNYLTPPTSKWFKLRHRNQALRNNKAIMDYFEDVTDEVHYTLNRSNYYDQIKPAYKASGVYGTTIMIIEEDIKNAANFMTMPIKQCVIVENASGHVDRYFIEFQYTAQQAAERFGAEKLSQKIKEELAADKETGNRHPFLLYIARREQRDVRKSDKANLPVAATWIDVEGKSIIDEGGYNEFPAVCHRFDKRPFIEWGYSPAMKAMPFARILNACAKTNLRALMKHTDPPVAVPNNAFIMPFNQNPRATNYYNKDKMDAKDIFAFGNYGDPKVGMSAVEYYTMQVRSIMYYDVFLAFNQLTKQMNNPEVAERINEKMTMLGPAVGRWIFEGHNPTIERVIGILSRQGRLPAPPPELIADPGYEIDIVSQLAQAQKRSELNALLTGLQLVGQMAQVDPTVLDVIRPDKTVREAWTIVGASSKLLKSDDEVAEIRAARAQVAEQQQQMNLINQGAAAVESGSKTDLNIAKAQEAGKK